MRSFPFAPWLAALMLASSGGCSWSHLRSSTLNASRTIPDIQERQVLDNLARVADDPGNLPYYAVVNAGLVNLSDSGSGGLGSLGLQHRIFPSASLNANASRTISGNWSLNPSVSPDRIRAMRAAYQIALDVGPIDPIDLAKLDSVIGSQPGLHVPQGWMCVGGKHDVPKGCPTVAHSGETYVWVDPGRTRDYADFSLLILNIATATASVTPDDSPTKISLSIDKLPPIQIREGSGPSPTGILPRALPPDGPPQPSPAPAPSPAPSGIRPRLYEDSPTINRGLFFLPR
jgi:hypothetical protein